MATLTAQNVRGVSGAEVTLVAASATEDRAPVGSGLYLLVRNGSGAPITVTLDSTGSVFNGQAVPDTAVTVAAGADRLIPLKLNYRSTTDGLAGFTCAPETSVTVAVVQT